MTQLPNQALTLSLTKALTLLPSQPLTLSLRPLLPSLIPRPTSLPIFHATLATLAPLLFLEHARQVPPQGLCICCSFCQLCPSPRSTGSLPPFLCFMSLLRCHFLREAFANLVKGAPSPHSLCPFLALLLSLALILSMYVLSINILSMFYLVIMCIVSPTRMQVHEGKDFPLFIPTVSVPGT